MTEYRHSDVIEQVAREIVEDLTDEEAAAMAAGDTAGLRPYDLPGSQSPRDVSGYLDDDWDVWGYTQERWGELVSESDLWDIVHDHMLRTSMAPLRMAVARQAAKRVG